jgi:hypothetical protein
MFSIIKNLKSEFDRGLDEAKLVEFHKKVSMVKKEKLLKFCEEIHYIMQRHYNNETILNKCKKLLKYIEEIIKYQDEIKNVKTIYY